MEADLIECLQSTPFLTKLFLIQQGAVCITTETLSRLTNRGPGKALCLVPKLQCLQFQLYPTLDGPAFADMIQSRWRPDGTQGPVAQLDKVVIGQDSEGEATIESRPLARLRQYRDEGLDIYRTMGPPYGRYQL